MALISAKMVTTTIVANLSPAASTLALGVIEVDLSAIPEGKNVTIKWTVIYDMLLGTVVSYLVLFYAVMAIPIRWTYLQNLRNWFWILFNTFLSILRLSFGQNQLSFMSCLSSDVMASNFIAFCRVCHYFWTVFCLFFRPIVWFMLWFPKKSDPRLRNS